MLLIWLLTPSALHVLCSRLLDSPSPWNETVCLVAAGFGKVNVPIVNAGWGPCQNHATCMSDGLNICGTPQLLRPVGFPYKFLRLEHQFIASKLHVATLRTSTVKTKAQISGRTISCLYSLTQRNLRPKNLEFLLGAKRITASVIYAWFPGISSLFRAFIPLCKRNPLASNLRFCSHSVIWGHP